MGSILHLVSRTAFVQKEQNDIQVKQNVHHHALIADTSL